MEKYENKVLLQGIIIRKSVTEQLGSLVIETTRKNNSSREKNSPCVCFFNDMKKELDDYKVGDFVTVEGEVQSYTKDRKRHQSVCVKSIHPAKSRIEEIYGEKGGHLIDKKNEVHLIGTVTNVQETDKVWNIFFRTVSEGHVNNLLVKLYKLRSTQQIGESIQRGDNLCIIGTLQTKKRQTSDGSMLYFENVVAMEVSKVS